MATPTDICNMAISRLGQPKINDIGENSAAAIACRDHFEPVRDALLRGHPWNFATVRADLAEGATPEYGWSRSFTLPDDFLRLNTVNGVEASRCEADYSLTFRTIYSNADTLQVTYVKQVEDTTLFDPLFVEAFVLKLAAAIAPSIADPTEKGAMEGLSASRLRDAAFADASENRSMISTTSMGAASRYYRPQAVAFDAWGPSVGIKGGDGWTPLISLVNDAGREVVYVYDWTGGDGIAPKPGIGYVGRYGIVSNIADAVSIRGASGLDGPNLITTSTATNLAGLLKGSGGLVAAATAGTDYVAANDSRLSDARTPTAHASTHVTGGADKIRDATASQDGLMTSAFATKLDGIATSANNYVHPNHSGDVTSVADGATTIANNAVTYAKFQQITGRRLVGRYTNSLGDAEEVPLGASLTFNGTNLARAALTGDVTAGINSNATTIANDAVTYAKLQNVSATSRILGRKTAAAGDAEECTLSEVLDFVGSAAQGDILYRGASGWTRLPAGTSGLYLKTLGAGANPEWAIVESPHDRSHAITSTLDHTAGNWKVFHSNGSNQIVELPLGASGTYLKSNGASAAPTFDTPAGGGSSITGTGIAYVRSGGTGTGTIGNPSLPFPTAQAAWDAGARNLELGSGSHTITHYSTAPDSSSYETVRVVGLGKDSTNLTIDWTGTLATEESPAGKMPYGPRLISDHSVAITFNLSGSNAHSGDNNGGAAPQFEFQHCYIASFYTVGGNGSGSGSSGSTSGGMARWCETQSAFPASPSVELYSTLEANFLKGGLIASNVAYGGSDVNTALDSLTARVAQETYMRTTDFTDSSGTVSNVTGLSCAVAANEKVLIEIVGFRVGGAAGSGLQIAFTGPSSPTHVRYTLEHWNAVSTGRTVAAATAFNTTLIQEDGNATALPIRITLTLMNGPNAQTVQFRAGSENSGTSITLLQGLTMRVHRIP